MIRRENPKEKKLLSKQNNTRIQEREEENQLKMDLLGDEEVDSGPNKQINPVEISEGEQKKFSASSDNCNEVFS